MSSGTQVEMESSGADAPQSEATTGTPGSAGPRVYPTDEEILGMEPIGANTRRDVVLSEAKNLSSIDGNAAAQSKRDSSSPTAPRNDSVHADATSNVAGRAIAQMPEWMQALVSDPKQGPEAQRQAQQLWQEHQEFRAAFSSPDEARAIKELFPGGAQEARTLRQAAQAVDQIDAAIYSGDSRAQSEVVAELARANPAAFRSLFQEAAKVLAGLGGAVPNSNATAVAQSKRDSSSPAAPQNDNVFPEPRGDGRQQNDNAFRANQSPFAAAEGKPGTNHQSPQFDPAAYASFERSTNDAVARDVRAAVSDTLARVLPEGIAEGAARRIGDDIFNEIHRTLAADRTLSEQVGDVLRGRQFGSYEQQRVSQLLSGRAKQLVPAVARRVIGEWTTSVLGTARNKSARQAAAASRVDIAAPGGSLDSMPMRPASSREVNYASMSDDDILGM